MVIRYSEIWMPAFGQSDAGMNMLFAGQDMSRGAHLPVVCTVRGISCTPVFLSHRFSASSSATANEGGQRADNLHIGRQPPYHAHVVHWQPPCRLVLKEMRL